MSPNELWLLGLAYALIAIGVVWLLDRFTKPYDTTTVDEHADDAIELVEADHHAWVEQMREIHSKDELAAQRALRKKEHK